MGERQAGAAARRARALCAAPGWTFPARATPRAGRGPPRPRRASPASAIAAVAEADPVMEALVAAVGSITPPAAQPGRPLRGARARDRLPAARRACGGGDPRPGARPDRGPLDARRSRRCPTPTCGRPACRPTSWRRCATSRRRSWTAPSPRRPAGPGRRGDHRPPTAVRGIGRWTAEMFLMFELRRTDVWPVDDLGVRQGYGLAWGIQPPPPRAAWARSETASAPTAASPRATAGRRSRCRARAPSPACADARPQRRAAPAPPTVRTAWRSYRPHGGPLLGPQGGGRLVDPQGRIRRTVSTRSPRRCASSPRSSAARRPMGPRSRWASSASPAASA